MELLQFFFLNFYSFLNDTFFIQFFFFFTFFYFYKSKNVYYTLLYLFFLIIYLGIILSLNQAELFTGFLWTTEFTVILICLILFFYLNVEGNILRVNLNLNKINYFFYLFFLFFFFFLKISSYYNIDTTSNLNWIYFNYYFDDWYESLNNVFMNDFISLFNSYYRFNSIEFIFVGYMLLIASIVCVNLNKLVRDSKIESNSFFLKIFNYFTNYLNFSFLRKQNLSDQSNYDPNIRLFKKKKW